MKLFGSTTSPYVRRIRLFMANTEHEFIDMQIFAGKDRETLAAKNPTLKIPMLEDEAALIYDSRVIYRYLCDKFDMPGISWEKENVLTMIDAANDSLVQMLILKRSDIDTSQDQMYFNIQRERVNTILSELDKLAAKGEFDEWDYASICAYCLVDWIAFREMHDLSPFSSLLAMHEKHQNKIEVTATDPRS